MKAIHATDAQKIESFVIEVDGVRESQERCFVEAISAAMEIRRKSPDCKIRVCDVIEPAHSSGCEKITVAA